MIGGPVLFLLIAWWGLRALAGGTLPDTPIQRLRDGAVRPGMSQSEVVKAVGPPKVQVERESGGLTFRYMGSTWDTQRATFLEEDAYVDFGSDGRVSAVSFESRTPEPPK
jgi:hypothetical protein